MHFSDDEIKKLVDELKKLYPPPWRAHRLFESLHEALEGHLDNTGASCRVDLDGHDCCYVCNQAEDMLRVTVRYYEDE